MVISADKIRFPDSALTTLKQLMCNINPVADKSTYTNKQQAEMIFDVATLDAYVNVAEDDATPVWKSLTDTGGSGDITEVEVDAKISAHASDADAHHAPYTNSDAVIAMGAKSDSNPLNHDKTIVTKTTIDALGIDHGLLDGLGHDDHPQYFNKSINSIDDVADGTIWKKPTISEVSRIPSTSEKEALNGTGVPSSTNKFITEDGRYTDAEAAAQVTFANLADTDTYKKFLASERSIINGLSTTYLALSGGTITGALSIMNGGNVLMGTAGGFPFFPFGIVIGPTSSESEFIFAETGRLMLSSADGTQILGKLRIGDTGSGILSLVGFSGSEYVVVSSEEGVIYSIDGADMCIMKAAGIDMKTHKISNLGTPSLSGDAATKGYVDSNFGSYLPLSGGTVTGTSSFTGEFSLVGGGNVMLGTAGGFPFFPLGVVFGNNSSADEYMFADSGIIYLHATTGFDFSKSINMNGNKITGLLNPTAASDAVTKTYVDDYYLRRVGGSAYAMAGYLFTGGYGIAFESTTPMNTWITTGVEATKTYLQLMGKDEILISSGGASGNLRAKIDSNGVRVLNSDNTHSALISVNATGNLVLTVESGKGILFAEG